MTFKTLQKRSSEINKRPKPTELIEGELALNTNKESPGLFFSVAGADSLLIKAGPCYVGETAPVLENHQTPSVGEMWFVPSTKELKIWAKTTNQANEIINDWVVAVPVITRFRPPTDENLVSRGEVYFNTTSNTLVIKS